MVLGKGQHMHTFCIGKIRLGSITLCHTKSSQMSCSKLCLRMLSIPLRPCVLSRFRQTSTRYILALVLPTHNTVPFSSLQPSKPPNRTTRHRVYEHEIDYGEEYEAYAAYTIDSPLPTLQANATASLPPCTPHLTREQWHRLTDEAKKTWDLLTDEAKAIILSPRPMPPAWLTSFAPPPRCRFTAHALEHLMECLDVHHDDDPPPVTAFLHAQSEGSTSSAADSPNVTSVHEVQTSLADGEDEQALLAHVTKRKPLPPGNLKCLLSPSANKPSSNDSKEINVNGVIYHAINMADITYTAASVNSRRRQGALIDRGANGGIAGEDVRIIAKTDRSVDIQGIDNHRMNDIPIVTAGGVINTQHGEVIAIMHQYAYTGKGKTILSCGQLEAFNQVVHDKSTKVGGRQRIETLDGYIIPLNFRLGLPYLTIRPYTDQEWDTLPHVTLTSDNDWDPSILDNEMEDEEEWFNAMQDLPVLSPDPFFDEFGDYRHVVAVTEALLSDESIEENVIKDLPDAFQLYEHNIKPCAVDYQRYQSKFAFLPTDIIKHTFEKTTQFYHSTVSATSKKHYRSPFPACNVHRQSEPVATDTVYSDTPAIDCGVTAAQFFVGTESLVCDVYPLQSDKQFVNVLQDNIRRWGAMTKLISDRAQVEISKKVQDILRHFIIGDWQSEPYQQHQNYAERRYQDVKRMSNRLLDWSGAPSSLWLLALMHVCFITNHAAHASLGYAIPLQVLDGTTPDISPILQFDFYEPVYYKAHENGFPSESIEKHGRFVGISEHVGHALTFKILTDDTKKIIYSSQVHSAMDTPMANN